MIPIHWRLALSLAAVSASACAAPAQDLKVYAGRPQPSWQLTLTGLDVNMKVDGANAVIPPSAAIPASRVSASQDGKALTLNFKDSWYAGVPGILEVQRQRLAVLAGADAARRYRGRRRDHGVGAVHLHVHVQAGQRELP